MQLSLLKTVYTNACNIGTNTTASFFCLIIFSLKSATGKIIHWLYEQGSEIGEYMMG